MLAAQFLGTPSAYALTLDEAIARALVANERAQAADQETRAADARVGQARSFLLPDLVATGDVIRSRGFTTRVLNDQVYSSRDEIEGRLSVHQTIFDAQAWPLLGVAEKSRDAVREEGADEKRRLSFETAVAFLDVLNAERVTQAASERLDLARTNLEEVRVRFDAQLVGSNDVTRAELEAATAERELVDARGTASLTRLELGYLLGAPVEDTLAVPRDLLDQAATPQIAEDLSRQALERRPDVRAGRARVAALEASAREPNMRYIPDLDFNGAAWRTHLGGTSYREEDWTLGLALTWDLFDGGLRQADRSERLALARAADLDLTNLERRVAVEIEAARVAVESRQATLARADVALEAAERNAAEAAELYRRGLLRALEVVDANVQLFSAEVERVGAQYSLTSAFLALRAALGLDPLGTEVEP